MSTVTCTCPPYGRARWCRFPHARTWLPTGIGQPSKPSAHEETHRVQWPMGVVGAYGPSSSYPFGDYPSWFVRLEDCPDCWAVDWIG